MTNNFVGEISIYILKSHIIIMPSKQFEYERDTELLCVLSRSQVFEVHIGIFDNVISVGHLFFEEKVSNYFGIVVIFVAGTIM